MGEIVLDVALTPALLIERTGPGVVAVLIDALRATSTLAQMFALGARSVELPIGLREAQVLARDGRLVAAEYRSGAQARGCTVPVSPSRLDAAQLAEQDLVFCTTNGTRAARRTARHAEHLLFGSLLNATAVAERAFALAADVPDGRGETVVLVCAGRHGNRLVGLDDTYTAGLLIRRLEVAAARAGRTVRCTDAAEIALRMGEAYADPRVAFDRSETAEVLRLADSVEDVAFCARLDTTDAVPTLVRPDTGPAAWPVTFTA